MHQKSSEGEKTKKSLISAIRFVVGSLVVEIRVFWFFLGKNAKKITHLDEILAVASVLANL